MHIQFIWDEAKRLKNLKDYGLDFLDVHSVFEGRTATLEDDRFDYGERRLFTLGVSWGRSGFGRAYRDGQTDSRDLFSAGHAA